MKYLIIGLGSMGNRRARNLQALGVLKNDILGFDVTLERRSEFAKTHGTETVNSLEEAFSQKLRAVIISTPPDTHMIYAKQCAERGIPFFTEAGTSTQGMEELIALITQKKMVGVPSCTLRFHPLIIKMQELVSSGAIGRLLSFTHHCGQYLPDWHPWEDYRKFYVSKRSTGACREIVPFELNWLTWIVGWPTEVSGYKAKVSDLECDIDDIYQVLLKYDDKMLGHLQVDVLARAPTRAFRLLGSEGNIEWNAVEKSLKIYRSSTGKTENITENQLTVQAGYSEMSPEQMYINEMNAFLQAVSGVNQYSHSFEDDLRILKILNKIEQSSDKGLHIRLENEEVRAYEAVGEIHG